MVPVCGISCQTPELSPCHSIAYDASQLARSLHVLSALVLPTSAKFIPMERASAPSEEHQETVHAKAFKHSGVYSHRVCLSFRYTPVWTDIGDSARAGQRSERRGGTRRDGHSDEHRDFGFANHENRFEWKLQHPGSADRHV